MTRTPPGAGPVSNRQMEHHPGPTPRQSHHWFEKRLRYLIAEHVRLDGGTIGLIHIIYAFHERHHGLLTGDPIRCREAWKLANAGLCWLAQIETGGKS